MERKNIALQYGIHRSPSAANEGELLECINLEAHNGEITPSVMPEVAFTLQQGDKLLFVHTSGNYKNFIVQRGSNLCWFPENNKQNVSSIGAITPTSIHSVGNTLVILTETNMEYILFKSGSYKRIGSKPPFCSISFGLQPTTKVNTVLSETGSFTIEDANQGWDINGFSSQLKNYHDNGTLPSLVSFLTDLGEIETGNYNTTEKYVTPMTDAITASINKIVADNQKFGAFLHPFFVRYAYRMYDGSHYLHSAPIFMPVNMKGPVVTSTSYRTVDTDDLQCNYLVDFPVYQLTYSIVGFYDENMIQLDDEAINDWSDIISGLDIFVSEPIYPYKQSGYVYGYWDTQNIFGESLRSTSSELSLIGFDFIYGDYRNRTYAESYPVSKLAFMLESNPNFLDDVKTANPIYKVSEFNSVFALVANKKTEMRLPLIIKENVLSTIQQQEKLVDDYDSHNIIIPSFAHVYNGRLNISGITTRIFDGFPMESMVPYTYVKGGMNKTFSVKVNLSIEGEDISVVSKSNIKLYESPAYIYYPNVKCKSFDVYMYSSAMVDGIINMQTLSANFVAETHTLLNGSFYLSSKFGIQDGYEIDYTAKDPQPTGNPYIVYPNKIYTSEVNNPFFFPLAGRNSIGVGEIIAISSNNKAISPGQFGQYPLIVFSTDGIWAMQIGYEGLYESVHPISKDICINPNLLQTDGPILFATNNGLYAVMAEQVTNLSKVMKGRPENAQIPNIEADFVFLKQTASDNTSFNEFIEKAIFADDYINNRAIIYNPEKDYAYIYCLDCGMFSKMVITKDGQPKRIQSIVKAYPEVYMQSGTDIYTFVPDHDRANSTTSKGLLVTRTMAFGDPLSMKVINNIKLIYKKTTGHTKCRYAMYVSNDEHNWTLRNSLRGHSFKYFRFAIFTDLTDTDALQGMSVMYDYRRTGKLR